MYTLKLGPGRVLGTKAPAQFLKSLSLLLVTAANADHLLPVWRHRVCQALLSRRYAAVPCTAHTIDWPVAMISQRRSPALSDSHQIFLTVVTNQLVHFGVGTKIITPFQLQSFRAP